MNLFGVWMIQVIEDGYSQLQGFPTAVEVTYRIADFRKMAECVRFIVAVTKLAKQLKCVLITFKSFHMLSQMMVNITEAIPRVSLPVPIVDRLLDGKGLLARAKRLVIVLKHGVKPAYRVEGICLYHVISR